MSQRNSLVELRIQLLDFSEQCELKLRKNDHKTEWVRLPVEALIRKLEIELEEMKVAVQYEGPADAMNECVDIANFAMMLWDRLRQPTHGTPVVVPKGTWQSPTVDDGQYRVPGTALPVGEFVSRNVGNPDTDPNYTGRWTRHGTWMDGNRPVATIYKNVPAGGGEVLYYEDTPEVRARGLRIVPEHIAKHLEAEDSRV